MKRTTGWVVFVSSLACVSPAAAQQMFAGSGAEHDKVRVSGFLWRGNVEGSIGIEEIADFPGLEEGIDVAGLLGLTDSNNGFAFEVNAAAAKRHRFVFEISRLEHLAQPDIAVDLTEEIADIILRADTALSLREVHAFYNFLFVARPEVEAGVIAGIARFEIEASIDTDIGGAAAALDAPFPIFGGNLLANPQGPVRGYFELTGFPRVTIDELSGSQLDMLIRGEVFVHPNVGVFVGYRRYRLQFDDDGGGIAIDLIWDGFVFGGQARF